MLTAWQPRLNAGTSGPARIWWTARASCIESPLFSLVSQAHERTGASADWWTGGQTHHGRGSPGSRRVASLQRWRRVTAFLMCSRRTWRDLRVEQSIGIVKISRLHHLVPSPASVPGKWHILAEPCSRRSFSPRRRSWTQHPPAAAVECSRGWVLSKEPSCARFRQPPLCSAARHDERRVDDWPRALAGSSKWTICGRRARPGDQTQPARTGMALPGTQTPGLRLDEPKSPDSPDFAKPAVPLGAVAGPSIAIGLSPMAFDCPSLPTRAHPCR